MQQPLPYQHETEKTLRALDGMPELEPSPYLAGKIIASAKGRRVPSGWAVRHPALAGVLLAVLLLINLIALLAYAGRQEQLRESRLVNSLRGDFNSEQPSTIF